MAKQFPSLTHPATMPKMRPTPKSPSSKSAAKRKRRRKRAIYAEQIRLAREEESRSRVSQMV